MYRSLNSFHQCLAASRIDYAIIGGIAVVVWGGPRLTRDIQEARYQTYTFDKKWNSVKSVVLTLIGCS